MKKWKLVSGVALVFVLGALAGSLGTGFYLKHRFEPLMSGDSDKRALSMKRLARRLDLRPEQVEKIEDIVMRMRREHRKFANQRRVEMKAFIAKSVVALKRELDPAQQEKLDRMIRRIEDRKNRRHAPPERWNDAPDPAPPD